MFLPNIDTECLKTGKQMLLSAQVKSDVIKQSKKKF